MTTKTKPRKRPAKARPIKLHWTYVPAPKGTPREISEIERLFARYKWLEADQSFQAKMASTIEESDRLIIVHQRELDKIARQLAELRPTTLYEVRMLLEYFQEEADRTDGLNKEIFANVLESLLKLGRDIEEKARAEAFSEALGHAATAAGKLLLNLVDMKERPKEAGRLAFMRPGATSYPAPAVTRRRVSSKYGPWAGLSRCRVLGARQATKKPRRQTSGAKQPVRRTDY